MNAVGADHEIGLALKNVLVPHSVNKTQAWQRAVCFECCEVMTRPDRIRPKAAADFALENSMKHTAMDGYLRPGVAGLKASGLPPDSLSMFAEVQKLCRFDPCREQAFRKAQFGQNTDRVGQQVDPNAPLAHGAHGLIKDGFVAFVIESQGRDQTADPSTDDYDLQGQDPRWK